MSQTKEPWSIRGKAKNGDLHIEDAHGERVAYVYAGGIDDDSDARRIVACVNACAGISNEHLESLVGHWGRGYLIVREESIKLQQQRDELLAALKDALEYYRLQSQPKAARDVLKLMRKAIEKAES